ncbi:transcriptional regulator PtsJ [Pantoea sp. EA-12]|uniref:MocR-like B6 salvage transcription factor PtsJ n=1 Tax=Pantoea sp. EA-12 TaxID=3043303 RepID=UPI0024B527D6|nr:transcriptional regulator PtsJ [Pantoea sp. EA-12]MDI9223959.1 transcriptional regulator PtsJ [Pantoea sp. EA-12]
MMISGKTAGEIFEQIRSEVQSGGYLPGDTLPPVRELAIALEVNRNTVASAYKRLIEAGIAESRGRNGTVILGVAESVAQEGSPPDVNLIDLASGNPSASLLPDMSSVFSQLQFRHRLYGEPLINAELEHYGREWLGNDIQGDFSLSLTSGAVDAVERLLNCYLISGDRVVVEDPCFLSSINTLKNSRLNAVGISIDEEGLNADALEGVLASGVQAVIITPRAHNPTGWGFSATRAAQIRALLAKYPQVMVIVDDHFSLLSTHEYHSVIPPETLRWALVRSVSKFLGPDMRLAFVASDEETAKRLTIRLNAGSNWVSHILQDITLAALQSPTLHSAVIDAREQYQKRRAAVSNALLNHGVTTSLKHDGVNLWLPLKQDSAGLVTQLATYGWLVRSGEVFGLDQKVHGLRITVSDFDVQQAEVFARTLGQLIAH